MPTSRSTDPGFTLIELLIVMTVLGVLASAVLLMTGTFTDEAGDARDEANDKQCKTVIAAHKVANKGLPPTSCDQIAHRFASPPDDRCGLS